MNNPTYSNGVTMYATVNVNPGSAYAHLNGKRFRVAQHLAGPIFALAIYENGNTADFTSAEVIAFSQDPEATPEALALDTARKGAFAANAAELGSPEFVSAAGALLVLKAAGINTDVYLSEAAVARNNVASAPGPRPEAGKYIGGISCNVAYGCEDYSRITSYTAYSPAAKKQDCKTKLEALAFLVRWAEKRYTAPKAATPAVVVEPAPRTFSDVMSEATAKVKSAMLNIAKVVADHAGDAKAEEDVAKFRALTGTAHITPAGLQQLGDSFGLTVAEVLDGVAAGEITANGQGGWDRVKAYPTAIERLTFSGTLAPLGTTPFSLEVLNYPDSDGGVHFRAGAVGSKAYFRSIYSMYGTIPAEYLPIAYTLAQVCAECGLPLPIEPAGPIVFEQAPAGLVKPGKEYFDRVAAQYATPPAGVTAAPDWAGGRLVGVSFTGSKAPKTAEETRARFGPNAARASLLSPVFGPDCFGVPGASKSGNMTAPADGAHFPGLPSHLLQAMPEAVQLVTNAKRVTEAERGVNDAQTRLNQRRRELATGKYLANRVALLNGATVMETELGKMREALSELRALATRYDAEYLGALAKAGAPFPEDWNTTIQRLRAAGILNESGEWVDPSRRAAYFAAMNK